MGQSAARSRPQCVTGKVLRKVLQPVGLTEAHDHELAPARALAARLIDPKIAGESALRALLWKTGYGLYLAHEDGEVSGVLALLMLNKAGLKAVEEETFDALKPALQHVVTTTEEPCAIYGWGVLGATREAATSVVEGCRAVIANVPFPIFARAATTAGLRMLTEKLAFSPYPDSATGLLWCPERTPQRRAA